MRRRQSDCVDALGYQVPACSYSGTASAPRAAGGGCATSWAPVGRGHKRMSPGVAVPGRLRQGSATVQDLTSPIARQLPISAFDQARRIANRKESQPFCLRLLRLLLRIHPAQPRRWETVRYAPLACTKRKFRPRRPRTLFRNPAGAVLVPGRGGMAFPVPVTWYLWALPGSDHEIELWHRGHDPQDFVTTASHR